MYRIFTVILIYIYVESQITERIQVMPVASTLKGEPWRVNFNWLSSMVSLRRGEGHMHNRKSMITRFLDTA